MQNDPQLVYVNPFLMDFNPNNPRKHGGLEFEQLKQSVSEVGFVQLPSVRVMPGNRYQVIDGEGRVLSARTQKLEGIWVVSFGIISDAKALEMLMSANTVRTFGFMAQCRGMAELHRQGRSTRVIASDIGLNPSTVADIMGVGYFPESILSRIESDMALSDTRAQIWGYRMFANLLPLRQIIGDQDPAHAQSLDGLYDYVEVEKAVNKVISGEINNSVEMQACVASRRLELFEERVDAELNQRLQVELAAAKEALAQAHQEELGRIEKDTAKHYLETVTTLEQQVKTLTQRYNNLVADASKRPEALEKRQAELDEAIKKTQAEREALRRTQEEARAQAKKAIEEAEKKISSEVTARLKEQQTTLQVEYDKARKDLEAFYAQKDRERQRQAEKSVRQSVAHGVELLAQVNQWLMHITSQGMLPGLEWLSNEEKVALIAQITAVRNELSNAIENIGYRRSEAITLEGR